MFSWFVGGWMNDRGLSISDSDRSVPAELGLDTQASSCLSMLNFEKCLFL